jgi:hypothetical protein
MADELFYNDLGDNLEPDLFEFTAGSGYADNVNLDAGKAIAYATAAWFFGPVSPYEYIGRIGITLTPDLASTAIQTAIPASTGGWVMGGAGVWESSTPDSDTIPPIDEATGLPFVSEIGFVFAGGTTEPGEAEAISTLPPEDEIVSEAGFAFCGSEVSGNAATTLPVSTTITASGGFVFGGAGVWVGPGVVPATVLVGSGGFAFGGAGQLSASIPTTTEIIGAGGFKFGGLRLPPVEVTYPGISDRVIEDTVAFEFGGAGIWEFGVSPSTIIVSEGAVFILQGAGLVTAKAPPIAVITGDALGGFALGGAGFALAAEIFEAWVLSGQNYEPSVFSGFDFNSFAVHRGQAYAAGEDGIYLLGGDTDDGEVIHTGVRIGPVNFGSDREKRMRGIQFGSGGPDTRVRVSSGTEEDVFTPDRDDNRVVVSREIQGREFVIDILDFQELSQFEATPLKLARR